MIDMLQKILSVCSLLHFHRHLLVLCKSKEVGWNIYSCICYILPLHPLFWYVFYIRFLCNKVVGYFTEMRFFQSQLINILPPPYSHYTPIFYPYAMAVTAVKHSNVTGTPSDIHIYLSCGVDIDMCLNEPPHFNNTSRSSCSVKCCLIL